MASDDLDTAMVTPDALSDMPGSPFTADEVSIAVDIVRQAVGRHIAPIRTEVHTFDVPRMSAKLFLPTGKLITIDEVVAAGDTVSPANYEASTRMSVLRKLSGYWPIGYDSVRVEMTHGHEECPNDLLPIIAAVAATTRRDQSVRQAVTGTYVLPLVGIDNVIYRYIPWHKRFGWA